jgi:hypothetical protein
MTSPHDAGVIAAHAGDLVRAETLLRCSSDRMAESRFSLSKVLLAQGRYGEAWPLYESRRELARLDLPRLRDYSEWGGEPLDGRPLFVVGEQGFGDEILFARFLTEEATYICSKPVAGLFPSALAASRKLDLPQNGCWCLVGSLPYLLGIAYAPPPVRLPFHIGSGGGIGVMAQTNPNVSDDPRRL